MSKLVVCLLLLLPAVLFAQGGTVEGNLTVVSNPPGAQVTLKGDALVSGVTPVKFRHTLIGNYQITVKKYGFENYNTKVLLDPSKQMNLEVRLSAKTRFRAAARSILIPGWGQRYTDQKGKGFLFTLFAAATTIGYFIADDDFDYKYGLYKDIETEFDAKKNSAGQAELANILERLDFAQERAYDAENLRRTTIGTVIAVWSVSLLDVLFFFPEEKGTFSVKGLSVEPAADTENITLQFSYAF